MSDDLHNQCKCNVCVDLARVILFMLGRVLKKKNETLSMIAIKFVYLRLEKQ